MGVPQGFIGYPDSADAEPIRRLADVLAAATGRLDDVDNSLDRIAETSRTAWTGAAADTFVSHMTDRGHVFELASEQVRLAIPALQALAATIDRTKADYVRAVEAEMSARARGSQPDWDAAVTAEAHAVGALVNSNFMCRNTLAAISTQLDAYSARSFIPIGEQLRGLCLDDLPGRDLVVDSLLATEDTCIGPDEIQVRKRIGPDEIQVRKLSDGSYVVVLPGVTDLSSNVLTPWRLVTGGSADTVRQTANALSSATVGGPNSYADMVKVALQRSGVPAGAEVTLVGHSYGAYTALDLANDDAFNSVDGDGDGYNVRVRNVYAFAADTDWKATNLPAETNAVLMNSRQDFVYQTEAQVHPEADWLYRSDRLPRRMLQPLPTPSLTSPFYWPVTTSPTGRANQIEVELNAGRQFTFDDALVSGHHPRNYAEGVPHAGDRATALFNALGDRTEVDRFNVRVPNAPRDTVPPVMPGP